MDDTDRINYLSAMAARIRAVGADQIKLDALVAALENEARLLRNGPDPDPLTEAEKGMLFDPITGDRKRVFQAGEIGQDRLRAAEMQQQADKAAQVVRNRRAGSTAPDGSDGLRPEPFRIGGPASEGELRIEQGREDDRRAATAAGLNTSAKPGPVSPIVNPPLPVSPGLRGPIVDANLSQAADQAERDRWAAEQQRERDAANTVLPPPAPEPFKPTV